MLKKDKEIKVKLPEELELFVPLLDILMIKLKPWSVCLQDQEKISLVIPELWLESLPVVEELINLCSKLQELTTNKKPDVRIGLELEVLPWILLIILMVVVINNISVNLVQIPEVLLQGKKLVSLLPEEPEELLVVIKKLKITLKINENLEKLVHFPLLCNNSYFYSFLLYLKFICLIFNVIMLLIYIKGYIYIFYILWV